MRVRVFDCTPPIETSVSALEAHRIRNDVHSSLRSFVAAEGEPRIAVLALGDFDLCCRDAPPGVRSFGSASARKCADSARISAQHLRQAHSPCGTPARAAVDMNRRRCRACPNRSSSRCGIKLLLPPCAAICSGVSLSPSTKHFEQHWPSAMWQAAYRRTSGKPKNNSPLFEDRRGMRHQRHFAEPPRALVGASSTLPRTSSPREVSGASTMRLPSSNPGIRDKPSRISELLDRTAAWS